MGKYKYIIFDIDCTLLDTEGMNIRSLMRIIKEELGIEKSYEELITYMAFPGRLTLKKLGVDNIDEVYPRWVYYVNEDETGAIPYEGMKEVLDKLKEQGYILAVASSKTKEQYGIDMVNNNFHTYMKVNVLVDDVENTKPHPEPLEKAIRLLEAEPEKCLYIGDTKSDYLCAKAAGVDFALALWGCRNKEGIYADYELEKPIDLLKTLF
ncbi:HAD family hydrolase [Clostridium sp. LIBA-8841]|uniref:HAD family hydrolase n=1 Tax=Clostridium sp. LIBA-8841 TaxID=2987530 RepID=UPI002AC50398|nr:HAD family hydrolase [Clostridium sp. LIBA-8841]MDZ5253986.1 HAD family hydrolase [Clostridium sp. LIBA-8841]